MNAIICYTGFVGSNLLEHVKNCEYYNSSNILNIRNKVFDKVYCCGLYDTKWKVDNNLDEYIESINTFMTYLSTVTCNEFILISTIDVLNCEYEQYEEPLDIIYSEYSTHLYGIHNRNFELWCLTKFANCYIFRLPMLFGKGLKNNALYDLINDNNVKLLGSHWEFQWYNIEWLYNDIQKYTSKNIKLVNLVTPPIKLSTIQTFFFPTKILSDDILTVVKCKIKSFHASHSIEDVLVDMQKFISNCKL